MRGDTLLLLQKFSLLVYRKLEYEGAIVDFFCCALL